MSSQTILFTRAIPCVRAGSSPPVSKTSADAVLTLPQPGIELPLGEFRAGLAQPQALGAAETSSA
ncbi:MAG: hypothetical protein ACREFY_04790 [Acetobacteraceae bacterium]